MTNVSLDVDKINTVEDIIGSVFDNLIKPCEIVRIKNKVEKLNVELEKFNILDYKFINRIKIKNLLIKTLSEENEIFMDIFVELLELDEQNFEDIVDVFLKITLKDLNILHKNLWFKRNNPEYDIISLKEVIYATHEFTPDLVMSHAYRVNKDISKINNNSIIIGDIMTIMPKLYEPNVFSDFEKLAYNNLIKIVLYIANKNQEDSHTYLCFNFTYIGFKICRILDKIKNRRIDNE